MKHYILFFFVFVCKWSFSQGTFIRLIDINIARDNYLLDFEINDSLLFAATKHLCIQDSINNIAFTCSGLSKLDYNGNIIQTKLLDSLYPEGLNRLLLEENKIFLSGHFHESFDGRPTSLLEFNTNFILDSIYNLNNESNTIVNNEGIIQHQGNYYLYGTKFFNAQSKEYSNIIKIDRNGALIWNKIYSRGAWKNEIYDLQSTINDDLVFLQYFNDGVGSQGESGFQIIKIDTSGLVLDSFEFEDISIDNPRLLSATNGSIFFTSQDPPYPHTIPSNGRINKIDNNLDSIAWSLLLPVDPFRDGHRYKVYDYLETSDGDIVVCGTVWEEGPDGPTETPDNHTWNGFVARITSSGQLVWLRIYRHPNNHPLLQLPGYGDYRPSYLNKIYETEDKNFIVAGSVYYTPYQETDLPENENRSSLWLMIVNNHGCLEDEECIENIEIDGINSKLLNFQIGTKWTYEVEEYPFPIHVTYQTFSITDTSIIDGKSVFVIENDFSTQIEYMYENDNKIFFWDDVVDSFRLHYDFDEMFQYYSPWASLCASQDTGTATVNIDSVSIYHLGNDSITIQNISISNNGTVNNDIITAVYKGIGLREFGIKLPLGMGLCDFNRAITKLRCFESGDIFYKFVDYSCDSTWFTTSINPVKNHEYVLFPNPTSGIINFNAELVGSKYKVFNITGEFISEGIIKDDYLFVPKTGTFILQLFNKRFYNTYLIIVQM